jgi:Tol biopolymer transport system component
MNGSLDYSPNSTPLIYNIFNFSSNSWSIGLSNTDGFVEKILLTGKKGLSFMRWFHDGHRFLYASIDYNERDTSFLKIYNILDNSDYKIWESNIDDIVDASISPDNGSIVLSLIRYNGNTHTWVLAIINSDGSDFRIIHSTADNWIMNPQFLSDNIIFFNLSTGGVHSISPAGDNLTRISGDTLGGIPGYAIDSKYQQIAYSAFTYGGGNKLFLTDFTGSDTRVIFDYEQDALPLVGSYTVTEPEFSPDGKKLVFSRNKNYITVLNLSDLHYQNYQVNFPSSVYNPSWTPDGNCILYALEDNLMKEIFILDLDSMRKPKLLEFENYDGPIFELSHVKQ